MNRQKTGHRPKRSACRGVIAHSREGSETKSNDIQLKKHIGHIQRLGLDGVGLGVDDRGRTLSVPGTLPDESIFWTLQHSGIDGHQYGLLCDVEYASDDRVAVVCPHFLKCGGCDFLHAKLAAQHDFKRNLVKEVLGLPDGMVQDVEASPRVFGYRALAKFVFGLDGKLGSYARRTHDVVDMAGCQIHMPVIERVANKVRYALSIGASSKGARYLVLRVAYPLELVHATLIVSDDETPAERVLGPVLASHSEIVQLWVHVNKRQGDSLFDNEGEYRCLHDGGAAVGKLAGAEQYIASGAFAQVNPSAAECLYATVCRLLQPQGTSVLDLYAGSGGISLSLASAGASKVLGIERDDAAVQAARQSASSWGTTVSFESLSAENVSIYLKESASPDQSGAGFPYWVVNPPRKGLAPEVIEAVGSFLPEKLVYVSCEPKTLARDVALLKEWYTVETVVPVDLFPHTRHIETVVLMKRRGWRKSK